MFKVFKFEITVAITLFKLIKFRVVIALFEKHANVRMNKMFKLEVTWQEYLQTHLANKQTFSLLL